MKLKKISNKIRILLIFAIILILASLVVVPEYKKVKTKEFFVFMFTTCVLIEKFYDEKGYFPPEENLIDQLYKHSSEDKIEATKKTNTAEFKYELGGGYSYRLYLKSKSILNFPAIECISDYKENYESKITHSCSVIE